METNKEMFEMMIREFLADSGEEMEDLVVDYDSIACDDDLEAWAAEAHDDKCDYTLYDSYGDVVIAYNGAR